MFQTSDILPSSSQIGRGRWHIHLSKATTRSTVLSVANRPGESLQAHVEGDLQAQSSC